MAIAIVQRVKATIATSGTGVTATVTATGSGNLLIGACMNTANRTVTSVTDGTNNFTQVPAISATDGAEACDIWYLPSSTAGKTSIPVVMSGAAGTHHREIEFYEVSGFTTPVVDVAGKVDSGSSIAGGVQNGASVTTTASAGFVVGVIATANFVDQNPLTGNEFSSGGDIFSATTFNAVCSLISASAAAHQPKWHDGGGGSGVAFASSTAGFKETVGGGTANGPLIDGRLTRSRLTEGRLAA